VSNRLQELSRADLLVQAAAIARRARPEADSDKAVAAFLEAYYRYVPVEDLLERRPPEVAGPALLHWSLGEQRLPGKAKVCVITPNVDEHGWATGHSVLQVVTDDMPFLVDSVTAAMARMQRPVYQVMHPVFGVRRDITGRLLDVLGEIGSVDLAAGDGADSGDGGPAGASLAESWIHVEFERETDHAEMAAIEATIRDVLEDVRAAVEDYPRMRGQMIDIADSLLAGDLAVSAEELADAEELLRWLADDHFTFLGFREYRLETVRSEDGTEVVSLRPVTGSGLGILRYDQAVSRGFSSLPPAVREKAREPNLLVLTKANSRSTVHRDAYLDYIGVKSFDEAGEVVGERRFLGLLASSAYSESVLRIPLLRGKVRKVLEASGFAPGSHSAKDLLQVLEAYPRDELFQISIERLTEIAMAVVGLQDRRQVRLFVRPDDYGRFLSCLVYLPQERMSTQVRLRVTSILQRATGGETVDYAVRIGESVLARMHIVIRMPQGRQLPQLDLTELQRELANAVRSWDDDFAAALVEQVGEEEAARLLSSYGRAFSEAYKEDVQPRIAVYDVQRLEQLPASDGLSVNLYQLPGSRPDERRFKVYRTGSPLTLTQVLPILSQLGVTVVDEWPYEIARSSDPGSGTAGGMAFVYDFGLRMQGVDLAADQTVKARFEDAFEAVWTGLEDSDGLNRLVLIAGLDHRQCGVLRGYTKYLRQTGSTYSQEYVEEALVAHPNLVRLLIDLFVARFDPQRFPSGPDASQGGDDYDERAVACSDLSRQIAAALDAVASLDQDRILRSFMHLILATNRTNQFTVDVDGRHKSYLSLKIDPSKVPHLPAPRPYAEIWVSSPTVEGVHLRFGPVARGGLRWSDRREDFRTEVLGLVKAQAVKNAVIVPVGAKGGFVLRHPPAADLGRQALLDEGIAAYRLFIKGLLDLTDNRLARGDEVEIVPPARVVRWDDDDAYLVVAADKGTATFSDIANAIALERGFWLGDAFASGGSAGYDHKAMGITARGAWESVKRHFREMGRNCQEEDFTCVGIGDMSGDVFGNGMLLSRHIRLVGAFDHRHVFLDPDPDAAASYAERERLFALPRSSWADYDVERISPGGGVWERSAKAVPISAEVRGRLGLPDDVDLLTPNDVIQAMLRAPVDLLWNGGIGTYVKASTETHADVGDKGNDGVRVDATDLRCQAVGEGGNLGFTQLARVEFARRGGRINTDAIDNAAGVDTSDHEVNLKILLDGVVRDGELTGKQRNRLLADMTDEVARLVLRHNYRQNVALSMGVVQAASLVNVHASYLRELESRGLLDRELERLPSARELRERRASGEGLSQPEIATLLGITKNWLYADLLRSDLPDEPSLRSVLLGYFPVPVRDRYADQVLRHPLRREIVATILANRVCDEAGVTFLHRLVLETAASVADLCRAHAVAREVFDLEEFTAEIDALDHRVPAAVQTSMRLEIRTVVERATRWFVLNRPAGVDVAWEIEFFNEPVSVVVDALPDLLTGGSRQQAAHRRAELAGEGVPDDLARRIAVLPWSFPGLGIVETSRRSAADLLEVARVHLTIGERLGLDRLLSRVLALPRDDRWQTMARAALRDELSGAHAAITAEVIAQTPDGQPAARLSAWEALDPAGVQRAKSMLRDVLEEEHGNLAQLSVGLRAVRSVLRGSAPSMADEAAVGVDVHA
jgi:glutamate dehydrogenase